MLITLNCKLKYNLMKNFSKNNYAKNNHTKNKIIVPTFYECHVTFHYSFYVTKLRNSFIFSSSCFLLKA